MDQYQVYRKDYKDDKEILLGVLTERRKFHRDVPTLFSGLKWARIVFGGAVRDPHSIYIKIHQNQGGASSVEYALMVLIVIAIIVAVGHFGGAIKGLFEAINSVWSSIP